jgi:hypothetical protein
LTLSGVETPVNLAFSPLPIRRGEAMENLDVRVLIRDKLRTSRLPLNGIPRFWVGPSDGEECHACDRIIAEPLVVEGIASEAGGRQAIQMHVACFAIWDEERREAQS